MPTSNQPVNSLNFNDNFSCRAGCGACCIAPSISSPIPGMPQGKKAGEACIHLSHDMRCLIFTSKLRPVCCGGLQANAEMCGDSREQALKFLGILEAETLPTKTITSE